MNRKTAQDQERTQPPNSMGAPRVYSWPDGGTNKGKFSLINDVYSCRCHASNGLFDRQF